MSVFSKPRTIRVIANPYAATDHKGRPSGAYPHKPNPMGDTHCRHVGATRVAIETSAAVMYKSFVLVPAEHDRSFHFGDAPEVMEVLNDDHYHRAIKSREVIAADKEAWTEAGLSARTFVEPKVALDAAKKGAVDAQIAAYGEVAPELLDHWKEFHEPGAPAPAAASAPASTTSQSTPPKATAKTASSSTATKE